MLNGGHSWRLYFYVVLAFAVALFILAFIFAEETSYDRKAAIASESLASNPFEGQEKESPDRTETVTRQTTPPEFLPLRKSYLQTLSPFGRYDRSVPFFATMLRSFTYFLVPQALWVITTYGIYIGIGAFVIAFTFPLKIVQPPYNWDVVSTTYDTSKQLRKRPEN